jgi:hypothetical protein
MLAGLVLIGVEWLFGTGAISAINLIGLGAILASVTNYRSERGLWMLALLYGGLFLGVVLVSEYFVVFDITRGAQPATWQVAVDFAIALRCQWLIVRAMAAVVAYNRRLTRRCS